MHEREAFTLRAYNSLRLNRKGHLSLPAIATSLRRLGLPATDENASAMLRYLGRAEDGYISYGCVRSASCAAPAADTPTASFATLPCSSRPSR